MLMLILMLMLMLMFGSSEYVTNNKTYARFLLTLSVYFSEI